MTRNLVSNVFSVGKVSCVGMVVLAAVWTTGCGVTPPAPQPSPQPQPQPTPTPTPAPTPQPDVDTNGQQDEQPGATPRLFIANFNAFSVTSYANPSTVNGNIAPDTNLQGAQTQLFMPSDLTVDNSGALTVSNFAGPSVTSYDDADTTNGNLAPDRNVQGAATQLVAPLAMTHQAENDLMFVADSATRLIYVYANASSAAFNGNLAPVRTIDATAFIAVPTGMHFGANDELYVTDNSSAVFTFANASTLNGVVAPTRIIESAVFAGLNDVFIDQFDNMLVVEETGFVFTFNNASTLNGVVAPDFTLQVQGATALYSVTVDSQGTGYIADLAGQAIFSYDGITTLNGLIVADRTIQGANTLLGDPIEVFMSE